MLTRADLLADQAAHPPYGTNLTFPLQDYCRLHQTSGTASGVPLRCLDRTEDWAWWQRNWKIIYRAAGIDANDRLFFPFSFGPFVGFWAAFETAVAMGNLAIPAGGMTTTARLRLLLDNRATIICCTPTYALHLAESAVAEALDLAGSPVRALIVAGEPGGSIPSIRGRIESAFGARVFDHAGMTEVGPYGFECVESPGAIHINETDFIPEVIEPQTGRMLYSIDDPPLSAGEVEGELVLTNLGRPGAPVIRYRTGDRVRLKGGKCKCGRWMGRLEGGVLGRSDEMLIVRGNNVYPTAVEAILREFSEIVEFRITLGEQHGLTDLRLELEPAAGAAINQLADRVKNAIRDRLNFRPDVVLVPHGTLPRFEMKASRIRRST
ncbi:MAG TPA: phenylacetate--CoA ligase family protein [Phycisphaerae bacterium]|nr:phenylacetate--CoA ligase family protein [Phycisphaerae bacterium]